MDEIELGARLLAQRHILAMLVSATGIADRASSLGAAAAIIDSEAGDAIEPVIRAAAYSAEIQDIARMAAAFARDG